MVTSDGRRGKKDAKRRNQASGRVIVRDEHRRVNISSRLTPKLLHVGSVGFSARIPLESRFM